MLPAGVDRGDVQARMRSCGVETAVFYPSLAWDHPVYREHHGIVPDDTPRAREAARRCLSLPVHPGLSESDLERVAGALIEALRSST